MSVIGSSCWIVWPGVSSGQRDSVKLGFYNVIVRCDYEDLNNKISSVHIMNLICKVDIGKVQELSIY